MSGTLPKGWVLTKVKKVIDLNLKNAFDDEKEAGFVPMSHVPINIRDNVRQEIRTWGEIKKGYTHFQDGDVIVAKITPCFENGKSAIINNLKNGIGSGSTEYFVMRPFMDAIDPFLLLALVKSSDFIINGTTKMTGSVGHKRVPKDYLLEYPLPLPPRSEQKRIAKKLDCLLAKVDACKARLDKVPEILKRFRQSVLADAVSGKLTEDWRETGAYDPNFSKQLTSIEPTAKVRRGVPEKVKMSDAITDWEYPESWIVISAADLLRKNIIYDLKDGNHGSNHPKVKDFTETGLPFITATQVNNNRIDYENAPKISGKPLEKLRVGFTKEKDVILTHKGTVGRVAICDRDCILTPQTTYYRIDHNYIDPEYLMIFLLSPRFQSQLNDIKSQTTRDFVPVTAQYSLFHLLPPIEEQREIIKRVLTLHSIIERLEKKLEAANKRVFNLTASILSKAFRGKLIPQDPTDEPAENLLKRIRAEREALAVNKKKGGRTAKKKSGRGNKTKPKNADAEAEPEPAVSLQLKTSVNEEKNRKFKSRKQPVAKIDKRFEKTDVLKAFRKAIFRQTEIDENSLLRLVGQRLGVHRLSKQIRLEFETYIKTAIRRKIIVRDGNGYDSMTATINHYDDQYLVKVLRSVIRKGYEYRREHVVAVAAEYLGFDKVSDAFAERMKAVFRTAIRRGDLYRNGIYVGKA